MKDQIIHSLKETEKIAWIYPTDFTLGALRLIEVNPLLSKSNSILVLHEFPDLNLELAIQSNPSVIPKYAAMSHVWKPSPAIAGRKNTRPLHITIKEGMHEISWFGLMQAAIAASHLKCDYIWLDFVCIHQTVNEDKALQIKNMANIYAHCSVTIIMLGGMRCAQRLEDDSFWHTRAWTLQEAVESVRRDIGAMRYALIEWGYDKSFNVSTTDFQILEADLAIVPIRELIGDLIRAYPKDWIQTGNYIKVPIHSLGTNKDIQSSLIRLLWRSSEWHLAFDQVSETDSSIRRSLWFRASSMEHDLLYSSMNLFSNPISLQVDYSVNFNDLLVQFLATLHKTPTIPYWFKIGHRIPVCSWSGLFPQRPDFKTHDLPTYHNFDANLLLCGEGCCDVDLCVEIMGASEETGHTVCAKILKLVRIAQTETVPVYTNRYWQHVRKILVSYIPGDETSETENWSFEIDADAVVEEVDVYSGFSFKTTARNAYDRDTIPYTPVVPQYNRKEKWTRSNTTEADLERFSSNSGSIDCTALCWFDGSLGPYLAIIGFYETHYQNPVVYFFDRTKDGNIQRVGTGKLLLAEQDRIKSDIPWRHLRVGGRGIAEHVIEKCTCENKPEVPLIKEGANNWWEKDSDVSDDESDRTG